MNSASVALAFVVAAIGFEGHADEPQSIMIHSGLVRSVAFSPGGRSIASGSFDGTVRLSWLNSGKSQTVITGPERVFAVAFSPDSSKLAAGCAAGVIKVFDMAERKMERTEGGGGDCWGLGYAMDGSRRGAAWTNWKLEVQGADPLAIDGGAAQLDGVVFSADGRWIASGGVNAKIWDAHSGELLRKFEHPGHVFSVAFSPDGKTIATGCEDAHVRLWDALNGELKKTLDGIWGAAHAIAFAPDGQTLAVGSADDYVRIFNVATGKVREALAAHQSGVWCVAYSPDGRSLVSGSDDGSVLLWDLGKLREMNDRIPPAVDLRPAMAKWGLRPKGQFGRNTCAVHTFTLNLEFAHARKSGRGVRLSDEFNNWAVNQLIGNTGEKAEDRGQWVEHQWMALAKYGICEERLFPFTKTFDFAREPSASALTNAAHFRTNHFVYRWAQGDGLSDAQTVRQIKTILARGWPVQALSPHCVLAVGYKDDSAAPGGGYFIICDSGWNGGAGGFVTSDTGVKLHTVINYSNIRDYGWAWIE